MAFCDYQRCAVCGHKAFYDAGVTYDRDMVGQCAVLCADCVKTYHLVVAIGSSSEDDFFLSHNHLNRKEEGE